MCCWCQGKHFLETVRMLALDPESRLGESGAEQGHMEQGHPMLWSWSLYWVRYGWNSERRQAE